MTPVSREDYWLDLTHSEEPVAGREVGVVRKIECVAPLDAQLGIARPLSVPAKLRCLLFPDETNDLPSGSHKPNCFAVLDGALVPGLPEILDASGLDHACLFDGAAAEELADVAPWLVRLEEDHRFTRALFTDGEGPGQYWKDAPGIFVRTSMDLEGLRRHFRRFTKIRDQSDRWIYFRYWDCRGMRALMLYGSERGGVLHQLLSSETESITIIAPDVGEQAAYVVEQESAAKTAVRPVSPRLTENDKQVLRAGRRSEQIALLVEKLRRARPAEMAECPLDRQHVQVGQLVRYFEKLGFCQMRSLLLLCGWAMQYGVDFGAHPDNAAIRVVLASVDPEHERMRLMSDFCRHHPVQHPEERRA